MSITSIKNLKELLELELNDKDCSNVFIVGHNSPDFDALGSAIGLSELAKKFNKDSYIIIDDKDTTLDSSIKKMIDQYKSDYSFIKKKDLSKFNIEKSLLIVTDVNKINMISVGDILDEFMYVNVIDHHTENEFTIDTDNKFISLDVSSASEVVARILNALKIKYDSKVSNALLAGICLDTKRFKQNTSLFTHDVAEKLIKNGADVDYVNNLFLEEFESYCRISNLIINGTIIKKYSKSLLAPIQVSFTLNRNNPREIYLKEDCAKAADQMLTFNGIDASFTLGYVDENNIHISARSNKKVNVALIMEQLGGGGNFQCAGAKIEADDILKVEKNLMSKIRIGISDEVKVLEEPEVIKVKRIKKA